MPVIVVVDIVGTYTVHRAVIIGWCWTLGDMLIRHWRAVCEAALVGQATEHGRNVDHPVRAGHKDSDVVGSVARRSIGRIALAQGSA